MRVGDRFRFVRDNTNGGPRYGRLGETGTVHRVYENEAGSFTFDNLNRVREIGFHPSFSFNDVVPLAQVQEEAVPAVNIPETTFYTVVYRTTGGGMRISGGLSEQDAADWETTYPHLPVVKRMKIKVRV